MTTPVGPDALADSESHPRPQLVRTRWQSLSGPWDFAMTDADCTVVDGVDFDRVITVPFPPESPASGIQETGFIGAVWYRRHFDSHDLAASGYDEHNPCVLLHFGAVDHTAHVWVNGRLVATHEGGQTPFTADLSDVLSPDGDNVLVVRAIDPAEDASIPRGKQDWREEPHLIWYHRTTGIWQTVWLECVPKLSIVALAWRSDLPSATVDLSVELSGRVPPETAVHLALFHEDILLAEGQVAALEQSTVSMRLVLPRQLNGQQYEELLWGPDHPTLINASVDLKTAAGDVLDAVGSYLGLRSVAVSDERLLLNDRPLIVRAVLAQNYWPETHLAATDAMLRREVELILALGFNTARVHQKAEDPRFLYWADRLGLMIWAETANAYAFNPTSVTRLVTEWAALVQRDSSHPSIITWVPLNESWGVQHIAHDERQRAYSRALTDLTRALDGARPVISNDGWEHTASDIWTLHDYETDASLLAHRYGNRAAVNSLLHGFGPSGRRTSVGMNDHPRPVMLTEFGGVSLTAGGHNDWGYTMVNDTTELEQRVTAILGAVAGSDTLAGFCYTQLTDTMQEVNGLLTTNREPKFRIERIRAAVRGDVCASHPSRPRPDAEEDGCRFG